VYGVVGQVIDGGVHCVVAVAADVVVVVPTATVVPVVEVVFVGADVVVVELSGSGDAVGELGAAQQG
jgi:hypothetical protein